MASRILLINFEEKYADNLTEGLNVHVDGGYFSDATAIKESEGLKIDVIKYYLTHPVYEYKVVFANLTSNRTLDILFKDRSSLFEKRTTGDFFNYWSRKKGIIVIFLGDYKYEGLINFGILDVSLTDVSVEDITAKCVLEKQSTFTATLRKLEKHIVMPTKKYISLDEKSERGRDWEICPIYRNLRGWILGCYCNARYSPSEVPSFIILPQFKDNLYAITLLLKVLAKIYPRFLPDLYEPDWIESDKYYPKAVEYYDKGIAEQEQKMKDAIDKLVKEKEQTKKEYENLRKVLYEKNDELKGSVIDVLDKYWSLRVTDMDEEKKKGSKKSLKEDILIEEGNRKILAEVKGTDSAYPSPRFITQVWQHLHYSRLGGQVEGALILNYDIKTEPNERSLAYTGEDKSQVEDIIFIDTRVLFELTIAVIDYGLSLEKAKEILLGKGRVKFDINDYKKNQTQHTKK